MVDFHLKISVLTSPLREGNRLMGTFASSLLHTKPMGRTKKGRVVLDNLS